MILVKRLFFHVCVIVVGLLILFNSFPIFALAASDNLTVSGWIPYWGDAQGVADARQNIKFLDTVHPFVFSVKNDGTLKDLSSGLASSTWKGFISYARSHDVEIIPSIMWSDGTQIDTVLSNTALRTQHENAIVDMVKQGKYDGVDIDYESKLSKTKDYFSLFLTELKLKLGSKILTCTIEPRTPPDSLYTTIPTDLQYANDYKAMAVACDRVEIMAYDQRRADLKLDSLRQGAPYIPLADINWVEKVVQFALKDIPANKLVLGVPTYGHQYTVTVAPQWYRDYTRVGSTNYTDSLDLAKQYKVTPGRNAGGEVNFTYFPDTSVYKVLSKIPVPAGTQSGNEAAAQALVYANLSGQTAQFNVVWYTDASAVQEKVDLAKKYHLRGVALFKIDGNEDPAIWQNLKK